MTRAEALALRAGDRLVVAGRTTYVVLSTPRQIGGRPLMITARRADDPRATAQALQLGAIRMERAS